MTSAIGRQQFQQLFRGTEIDIDRLPETAVEVLTRAGVTRADLERIAGPDHVIHDPAEIDGLFALIDRFDDDNAPELYTISAGSPEMLWEELAPAGAIHYALVGNRTAVFDVTLTAESVQALFSGSKVDLRTLDQAAWQALERAGVSRAELEALAGADRVIRDPAEIRRLFTLLDRLDRNGSGQSFTAASFSASSGQSRTVGAGEPLQQLLARRAVDLPEVVSRQQALGYFQGTEIDVAALPPEALARLEQLGIGQATLRAVAGSDGLITSGPDLARLYQALETIDRSGSSVTLRTRGPQGPSAAGEALALLMAQRRAPQTFVVGREQFLALFEGSEIDLQLLPASVREYLAARGLPVERLQALAGSDGKIRGPAELRALFTALDAFDRNGSGDSFIAARADHLGGQATQAGQLLGALLEQRQAIALGASLVTPAELARYNTPANVEALARVIQSECGTGNLAEVSAVAYTVLNRMHLGGYSSVKSVWAAYSRRAAPTAAARDLAAQLLRGELPDLSQGATHFYSPVSMPAEGESTAGFDVGGGLESVPGLARRHYRPSWTRHLERVQIQGIEDYRFKFYRPY